MLLRSDNGEITTISNNETDHNRSVFTWDGETIFVAGYNKHARLSSCYFRVIQDGMINEFETPRESRGIPNLNVFALDDLEVGLIEANYSDYYSSSSSIYRFNGNGFEVIGETDGCTSDCTVDEGHLWFTDTVGEDESKERSQRRSLRWFNGTLTQSMDQMLTSQNLNSIAVSEGRAVAVGEHATVLVREFSEFRINRDIEPLTYGENCSVDVDLRTGEDGGEITLYLAVESETGWRFMDESGGWTAEIASINAHIPNGYVAEASVPIGVFTPDDGNVFYVNTGIVRGRYFARI